MFAVERRLAKCARGWRWLQRRQRLSVGWSSRCAERTRSFWLSESASADEAAVDVERLFTDCRVQSLLKRLTSVDPVRAFRPRLNYEGERTSYRLMTDEQLADVCCVAAAMATGHALQLQARVKTEAVRHLQMPPMMDERRVDATPIAADALLDGHDSCKFVFTDVTFGYRDRERVVVVREPSGVLRHASAEEHDRMMRVYYPRERQSIDRPAMFDAPYMQQNLSAGRHAHLLDVLGVQYEPDSREYLTIAKPIYDNILKSRRFDHLTATRHFGGLLFYMVINRSVNDYLAFLAQQASIPEMADVVRLYQMCHPSSSIAQVVTEDDDSLLQRYVATEAVDHGRLQLALKTKAAHASEGDHVAVDAKSRVEQ